MTARRCMVLALGVCLIGSGCASTGGLGDYAALSGSPVKTQCRGAYLVTAHPSASKLLVTPYFASSMYKAVCEGFGSRQGSQNVTGIPFEEGAREYLVSVKKQPECQITAGTQLTPAHAEFTYSCPTKTVASPAVKKR